MIDPNNPSNQTIFDGETWAELNPILANLPKSVHLHLWGDVDASAGEQEAAVLCQTLADHFESIQFRLFPRRVNYPYYPVIGIMGEEGGETVDFGLRIIGLPKGYQMTSLITALQAVAFQGMTLEPTTRIKLHKLSDEVNVELMTSAENEGGPLMAKIAFGLAAASSYIRSYLIMSDVFPEANLRYSIKIIPHMVINGRVHVEGVVSEDVIVDHIAMAVTTK